MTVCDIIICNIIMRIMRTNSRTFTDDSSVSNCQIQTLKHVIKTDFDKLWFTHTKRVRII